MSNPAKECIKVWTKPGMYDGLPRPSRNRRPWKAVVPLLLLVAGCSSQSLPPVANADRARDRLQAALDAWQKGESLESLQKQVPALYVNDPDWRDNKKLVKYQIGSGQFHGQSWRCEAQLTLQDASASAMPRQVKYIIDTDPTVVVVRD